MSGHVMDRSPNTSIADGTGSSASSPYRRPHAPQSALDPELYQRFGPDERTATERFAESKDDKYLAILGEAAFSVTSLLAQRVLAHPCLVFRNQCQVNTRLENGYKLMPWSIVRPMHNIYKNQGIFALWKGIHNDFTISSVQKSLEMVISENTSLPLSLDGPQGPQGNMVSTYSRHILLKTISSLITAPLICAGYTLRVQSQVVVSDTNYFALFSEAYHRVISSVYSLNSETSHLLPLYSLVFPITVLSLGTYIIHGMCNAAIRRQYQQDTMQLPDSDHGAIPLIKTIYDRYYPRLLSTFSGQLLSDMFFYPLSTVTGRLILQGTRTIIDDADTGNAVLPFTSTYTGLMDCFRSIVRDEGFLGLYKGFGALMMQYMVQALILRGSHLLYERIMDTHYPRVPRRNMDSAMTPSSTYSSVSSLNNKP